MLTKKALKSLNPKTKPYRVFDDNGLHVVVSKKGTRTFRLTYRLEGKERTLTLGTYPVVGLAEARNLALGVMFQ